MESEPIAKRAPNWWHRDHPVFIPLAGFFTGMLYIIIIPGTYGAILNGLFTNDRAESLFPFVLLAFVVPIGMLAHPRTRRFGRCMLFGSVATLVVVVGVTAITLWILYSRDG